jgi:GAF domain-containing protein
VRAAISAHSGLLGVSAAVAEEIKELFMANACSITLIDERGYRDLVNVGELDPGDERFPPDEPYPTVQFPLSTAMLLEGGGYLSSSASSALYKEFQAMWPQHPAGSFLGVPIVAAGEVRGELYLSRAKDIPVFTSEDVDAARDLATLYGSVLPGLLDEL